MAEKNDTTFQMRAEEEFLAALDKWRNARRPALSRAAAIRTLVFRAAALVKSEDN